MGYRPAQKRTGTEQNREGREREGPVPADQRLEVEGTPLGANQPLRSDQPLGGSWPLGGSQRFRGTLIFGFRRHRDRNAFGLNGVRRCAVTPLLQAVDNGPKRAQIAREIRDRFLDGVEAVLEGVGDRGRHG